MAVSPRAVLKVVLPLATAVACAVIAFSYVAPGVDFAAMARGVVSPVTWPKTMLLCAATAAALLALVHLLESISLREPRAPGQDEDYHEGRSISAIGLLVAYGIVIPFVGIAWATPNFIAGWLLLGGIRKPLKVGLISILGTIGVLYFFVKLSSMPLDRGKGVFEQATVTLYRLLGIY